MGCDEQQKRYKVTTGIKVEKQAQWSGWMERGPLREMMGGLRDARGGVGEFAMLAEKREAVIELGAVQ